MHVSLLMTALALRTVGAGHFARMDGPQREDARHSDIPARLAEGGVARGRSVAKGMSYVEHSFAAHTNLGRPSGPCMALAGPCNCRRPW